MGLATAIGAEPDVELVGEAGDGEACLELLRTLAPDILLLDIALPRLDGFEILRWARLHRPSLRTIVLSMYAECAFAERARHLGAAAFIAKEDALSELQNALRHDDGSFYRSAAVVRNEAAAHRAGDDRSTPADDAAGLGLLALSPTERRIMGLLGQSMTSREIALRLGISARTVQTHRTHITEKLGVRGSHRSGEMHALDQAARRAFGMGPCVDAKSRRQQ